MRLKNLYKKNDESIFDKNVYVVRKFINQKLNQLCKVCSKSVTIGKQLALESTIWTFNTYE